MRTSAGRARVSGVIVLIGCALIVASIRVIVYSPNDHSSFNSQSHVSTQPSIQTNGNAARSGASSSPPSAASSGRRKESELERFEQEDDERGRYDQPGEAAEFYRRKRLPEGATEMPVELYLRAMEKMRDLPIYSTLHNRLFPSSRAQLNGAQAPDLALLDGWRSLGPGNIGGRTRALLIHPANPSVIYAAAAAGGVWKTEDGGGKWRPLTDLLPNLAVNALAMDPANPNVIYAGTGEGYFNGDAVRGAGIFKSIDGGLRWQHLERTATPEFHYVNDLVVSPTKSNQVYAATRAGVMRSLDGGATWNRVHQPDGLHGGCFDLAIRTDQPKDYILVSCGTAMGAASPASSHATIYRSADAAAGFVSWNAVHTEFGMGRTSLAIAPSNQDVVYAVAAENGADGAAHSLRAVFRSNAGGAPDTWVAQVRGNDQQKLNRLLFTNPVYALYDACYGRTPELYHQGWYNNVIAVDPKDENIVWVGGVDLFRSDDGGVNWGMASFWHLPANSPDYVHADHHAIVFHPQFNGTTNRTMFVGNDGGVFRADNARAQTASGDRAACSPEASRFVWTSLNRDYAVTQFYHGAVFPDGARYLGGAQDNGVLYGSDEAGSNGWKTVLSGDGGCVLIDWTNPRIVYAATTWLSLKKSTDGGMTFGPAPVTNGIRNVGFNFITPFVMDPNDPTRLWTGGKQMWRYRGDTNNWTQASADLADSATAIAVARGDSNFVLAGTKSGQIHRTTTGLISGADAVWPYARPRSGYVSSVAFDPTNRDIAYATYSTFDGAHVWRSQDAGVSWHPIDGGGQAGLPDIPVNCIAIDPLNPQRLYLGTDLGIFVSPDGGATWAVENTGFAAVPVESLSLNTVGYATQLFAFTHGRGVWRVPLRGACSFSLSPADHMVGGEGGKGSVNLTASRNDCEWMVEDKPDWVTLTSDASGRGSGAVTYNVAPNTQGAQRKGMIAIAGKSVEVAQMGAVTSVSAASLRGGTLAPESIVSAFGVGLAGATLAAGNAQLPTALADTTVTVRDSAGVERRSPLFFISRNQVNYQMPKGSADGPATVMVVNGNEGVFSGAINIARVAPGLFTANASGQGAPVGQALRVRANGQQSFEPLAVWDAARNRFAPNPIDLSNPTDQVFLILYGTGWRYRGSLSAVSVKIGGIDALVLFAEAQGSFAGLDQINLQIPRACAGKGELELVLTVDGQPANIVRVNIK